MNFYHLEVFYTVAKRLSYSRAAEELFISQPAVSRHVHALEKELGAKLLGQVGNRVYLTDAGRIVFDYAQRVFALTEETKRALAEFEGLERGYLRLGASSTPGIYLLPSVITLFRQRYPGVEVSLDIANSQQIEEKVLRNELDLGFVGARFLPELHVQPYVRDELVLIVPPSHQFASREAVSPQELDQEIFILREAGSGTRRVFEQELSRLGITLRRPMELTGCEAVKRAVAAGMGIAVVSEYSVSLELAHGLLCRIKLSSLQLARELSIVSHKNVRPSAAALAFLALLRKTSPSR
ncbi:MAG: selenium metabolism-associated LysR family transcriptional regulator [Dehalococcoidia bacterium]|nr:selenium metabolism-associated LysR family transcriptional regulator [Dehalococcoidia bacterium]